MIKSLYSGTKGFRFLLLTLVAVLVGTAWLFPGLQKVTRISLTYGGLISAVLSLVGFILLSRGMGATAGNFIGLVVGGMIGRLALALALIAFGIGLFNLSAGALVGSCLITYVIFTVLEHLYLLPLPTNRERV